MITGLHTYSVHREVGDGHATLNRHTIMYTANVSRMRLAIRRRLDVRPVREWVDRWGYGDGQGQRGLVSERDSCPPLKPNPCVAAPRS